MKALIPNLTWSQEAKAFVAFDKKGAKHVIEGLTPNDIRYLTKRLKASAQF